MANIKIPSIRIYDKENDKVLDNKIYGVEWSADKNYYELDGNVSYGYNSTVLNYQNANTPQDSSSVFHFNDTVGDKYTKSVVFGAGIITVRTAKFDVVIPRQQDNGKTIIMSAESGVDENNNAKITYSTTGTIKKGSCSLSVNVVGLMYGIQVNSVSYRDVVYDRENSTTKEVGLEYETDCVYGEDNLILTYPNHLAEIDVTSQGVSWDEDNFYINGLIVPVAYSVYYTENPILQTYRIPNDEGSDHVVFNRTVDGKAEQFVFSSIEINIPVSEYIIKESSFSGTIGDEKTEFSIEKNSLMSYDSQIIIDEELSINWGSLLQENGAEDVRNNIGRRMLSDNNLEYYLLSTPTYNTDVYLQDGVGHIGVLKAGQSSTVVRWGEITQYWTAILAPRVFNAVANKIIKDWQKGKETATIRVSVNDYYDTDGNIAVSINKHCGADGQELNLPMLFKNGDKVIPFVATPNGDRPMSLRPNGSPKSFRVTGVTLISDGAVWQELQLQEVSD